MRTWGRFLLVWTVGACLACTVSGLFFYGLFAAIEPIVKRDAKAAVNEQVRVEAVKQEKVRQQRGQIDQHLTELYQRVSRLELQSEIENAKTMEEWREFQEWKKERGLSQLGKLGGTKNAATTRSENGT